MATPTNDAYQAKAPLTFRPPTITTQPGGAGADGDYGDITISSGGSVVNIDAGAVGTTELADDSVTLAKIQELSANRLLGTGTAGNPTQLRIGSSLTINTDTLDLADANKGAITLTNQGTTVSINSSTVTEAMQVLADNTTQDVSTTKHGYVPKAPNDSTKFLRGDATWAVPAQTLLTDSPGTDHTFSGPSVTLTAGENLAFPDCVYPKSDSKMGKADADAAATAPVVAMASATIANNATGVFVLPGSFVRDDTWNWTPGGYIYLDTTTAGGLTQTAPSGTDDVVQIIGWAYTADVMFFNPQLVTVVVV